MSRKSLLLMLTLDFIFPNWVQSIQMVVHFWRKKKIYIFISSAVTDYTTFPKKQQQLHVCTHIYSFFSELFVVVVVLFLVLSTFLRFHVHWMSAIGICVCRLPPVRDLRSAVVLFHGLLFFFFCFFFYSHLSPRTWKFQHYSFLFFLYSSLLRPFDLKDKAPR